MSTGLLDSCQPRRIGVGGQALAELPGALVRRERTAKLNHQRALNKLRHWGFASSFVQDMATTCFNLRIGPSLKVEHSHYMALIGKLGGFRILNEAL